MKTTVKILTLAAVAALATPVARATEEDDQVREAAAIMRSFKAMPEREIPRHVLRDAKGLAILRVVKGGFIWSGKVGEGVVVARTRKGWSGPSFIRTAGVGFGPQIGGQLTDYVLVLNTDEAVQAFANRANVQLGGELSVAAGPVGRNAGAGVMPVAAVYSYSLNRGLFAGASLEGTVIGTQSKANARYYNAKVQPSSILAGKVSPRRSAGALTAGL